MNLFLRICESCPRQYEVKDSLKCVICIEIEDWKEIMGIHAVFIMHSVFKEESWIS